MRSALAPHALAVRRHHRWPRAVGCGGNNRGRGCPATSSGTAAAPRPRLDVSLHGSNPVRDDAMGFPSHYRRSPVPHRVTPWASRAIIGAVLECLSQSRWAIRVTSGSALVHSMRGCSGTSGQLAQPQERTVPADEADHCSSNGVHADLVEELLQLLNSVPSGKWIPISRLYNDISFENRRKYVRPHKTLGRVLHLLRDSISVTLTDDQLHFCKGVAEEQIPSSPSPSVAATAPPPSMEPNHAAAAVPSAPTRASRTVLVARSGQKKQPKKLELDEPSVGDSPGTETHGAGRVDQSLPRRGATVIYPSLSPSQRDAKAANQATAPGGARPASEAGAEGDSSSVDFYYDVALPAAPDPPADFDVVMATLPQPTESDDGAVLSLTSFVAFIPPFFVPLEEALETMPGYTEKHVEQYLSMKAVERVSVNGRTFIRIFGGYRNISLSGCEVSEEQFKHYKPSPELALKFAQAFGGVRNRWMPLRILVQRADPSAVAGLPFDGAENIVFFAQMQHLFNFAPNEDGGAVLLRDDNFDGLECETSPTPKVVNFLLSIIPVEGQVDVSVIENQMPAPLMDEVKAYFSTLERLLRAHKPVFYLSDDGHVVMRTRYKERLHLASLSLEQQLDIAVQRRDKKRIRLLRRRIAFQRDPNHALHDPENLAREISRLLPQRGHVILKLFMVRQIPEEIRNYLPRKYHNFFANYPQYFQVYEFQYPGQWCISRPGQPIPRGVIRQEFSEEDLVRLVAEYLQQRGPRSCSAIILHLPRGALEAVQKRHGGIFYLVKKYPQYFNLVLGSDTGNVVSGAVAHLVQLPDAQFNSGSLTTKFKHEEDEEDDTDDE